MISKQFAFYGVSNIYINTHTHSGLNEAIKKILAAT